jgi:hypothetical protein
MASMTAATPARNPPPSCTPPIGAAAPALGVADGELEALLLVCLTVVEVKVPTVIEPEDVVLEATGCVVRDVIGTFELVGI